MLSLKDCKFQNTYFPEHLLVGASLLMKYCKLFETEHCLVLGN